MFYWITLSTVTYICLDIRTGCFFFIIMSESWVLPFVNAAMFEEKKYKNMYLGLQKCENFGHLRKYLQACKYVVFWWVLLYRVSYFGMGERLFRATNHKSKLESSSRKNKHVIAGFIEKLTQIQAVMIWKHQLNNENTARRSTLTESYIAQRRWSMGIW